MKTVEGFVYLTRKGYYLYVKKAGGFGSKYELEEIEGLNNAGIFPQDMTGKDVINKHIVKHCVQLPAKVETIRKVSLLVEEANNGKD